MKYYTEMTKDEQLKWFKQLYTAAKTLNFVCSNQKTFRGYEIDDEVLKTFRKLDEMGIFKVL